MLAQKTVLRLSFCVYVHVMGFCTKTIRSIFGAVRKRGLTFLTGFVAAVLGFLAINAAMKYTSRSEFCAAKCHEMKTAYRTWELSAHGANKYGLRVECIDCHLPPKDKFFAHLAAKSYAGAKDICKHYLGGEYDLEKTRKNVLDHISSQRCLHCHDSLLGKPGSSAARKAHLASLARPEAPENRCVACHEDAGHQRQKKLFSP